MVKLVKNRAEPILEYIKGKNVLEIGCVGMGKHDTMGGNNFIAGYIKPLVNKLIGIDINSEGVKMLRLNDFDARLIDAEKPFNINETFDIVLAEEVMEHLSNLPTFLNNVSIHLKDDGMFIISTPNPISHSFFFQRLFGGKINDVAVWNHTHWHTHETLSELLKRYGFMIIHYEYIHPMPAEPALYYPIIKLIWRFVPNIFGRNLLVISRKNI